LLHAPVTIFCSLNRINAAMSRAHRKTIAWIAAAALLFSALSPAMASVLFRDRPDILVRILGVPAQHAAEHGDTCQQDASLTAHDSNSSMPGSPADDASGHAAHGIYCSFCLAASATVTVPGAPQTVVVIAPAVVDLLPAGRLEPPPARLPSTHRSRAPPRYS
jgi:Protein of unknown function (DUF2946)